MAPTLKVFPTAQEAATAAAAFLAERLRAGGRAVFAGGRTPLAAYRHLAQSDLHWSRIQLIVSDERCVPPEAPERNDRALREALGNLGYTLHAYPAEHGPVAAAEAMEAVVASLVPFDLVLLGLGEDGHTASLFPAHAALEAPTLVAPVFQAPKPPPSRVTLTPRALSQTPTVLYLVTGSGKRAALRAWLAGEDLPPKRIQAPEVLVFADTAAGGDL
ncbi:6-phosphogluconolactonase [Marinithermus hydrothermalis]|uniref:6-phosphogluconolactonase n=1 Tax=Marinithermus hydrothermalis (strain DSM 14884 / JCM 11576 / T1) TaxID=869210 RepID=F2NLE6_MARHT|nr:6-phosphogluconolactonase [Marinithermus hydrothermalis]AEB11765.1 6-phosphogluconolactonase [Marinithermus hydrothermalis DSM 14884]